MKNRIAVITGAGSGIGRSAAIRLGTKGVKMVICGRDEDKLKAVKHIVDSNGANSECHTLAGDISKISTTDQCIAKCISAWQRPPDIFLASAGRGLPGTVTTSDAAEWDDLINTNVKGLMSQLKSISNSMLERITPEWDFVARPLDIIVIGSTIGHNVSPFNSVYGATKFAAHGLTEAIRRQLGPKGIRVTLIQPGLVRTGFQRSANYNLEWFEKYAKEVGPILEADDIAGIIEFSLQLPGNINLDNISVRPTRQDYP